MPDPQDDRRAVVLDREQLESVRRAAAMLRACAGGRFLPAEDSALTCAAELDGVAAAFDSSQESR